MNAMSVFATRFIFAALVVWLSYNPTGYSFSHWIMDGFLADGFASLLDPVKAIAFAVLTVGWVILFRATFRSLGHWGVFLVGGVIAAVMWLLFDKGLLDVGNNVVWQWVVSLGIVITLAVGTSWSMVRRRITGQIDTDDVSID